MATKKPRDRRDRTERARQERKDVLQREMDRQHKVIAALAHKRAARELTMIAAQETTLASSRGSFIPTTPNSMIPNSMTPAPPSRYAAIDDLEGTGGAQSPTAGHAFHLTQAVATQEPYPLLLEFEELEVHELPFEEPEAHELPFEEMEACELTFEALDAHEPLFEHVYLDEGESEMDPNDPAPYDCYPSESEAGEDDNGECGEEGLGIEIGMDELPVQGEWDVQDVQYSAQDAFEAERPEQEVREEWVLPGLHKQKDIDVEVNVATGKAFPSGLVNVSQENAGNPFKMLAPSIASNNDIDTIARIICFIVITLHFLAGLTTLWCIFLLKAFVFLLEALGRPDIAGQIPSRLPTAQSYSGIPPYHVTALPVCPTCGDVFPVGFGTPVDCPRCSTPLYEALLHPTNSSVPNPTRKALVPRIRLPFLSISAQLERVFSSPGIEAEVDWWRTLNRQEGVYRDISDGKIWGEIHDTEGGQFFRSVEFNGRKCAPGGELRIGVALAMDWYVGFSPCFNRLISMRTQVQRHQECTLEQL